MQNTNVTFNIVVKNKLKKMPNAVLLKHIHVRDDVDTEGVTATKWALDPNLRKRGPLKVSH